ncbi:hypothetical protein I4F81_006255 [Pyropia yezoensis]|uniref:Uncharacterized protein n=1 Tax=Pyropia yezoensis TaxID=2788 RepID=A0ACC3C087_PYRYE|nr:hypothetical protein I4F81_006255 [Neopyropia yezoensis]
MSSEGYAYILHTFTVEGVESVAADLKTLLAQVSTLSIKSTALREELEALRVAKPPRHPYFSDAAGDGNLIRADVESAEPRLMDGLMGTSSMALVPEEDVAGMDGVVSPFDRLLHDLYGAEGEVVYKQATLKRLGLPSVFSTPLSTADNLCGFNLHEDDFVPLRVHRSLANNFVAACKQFVSRLHAAGVVHGDLYISIFAWRLCAGVMEVEVFDWDIAFFIHKHIPQKLAETWRHTKKWSGRYDRLRVVPGPVDVGGVPAADGGVAAVVAGYHSNVLLTAAGGAYAWGWGAYGQLGVGDPADRRVPCRVATPPGVRLAAAAVSDRHALAVDARGGVWVWGTNEFVQRRRRGGHPSRPHGGGLPGRPRRRAGEEMTAGGDNRGGG